MNKMKTAFVTGGAGFLGLNLIDQLVAENWCVVAMDLKTSTLERFKKSGVQVVVGDITDLASCKQALPKNTDAVFHLAGNTSHWKLGDKRQSQVNVDGTRHMVQAALSNKARRLIYTSSIAAFGFQPGRITEKMKSSALHSKINYFRTKRLAELEVHEGIKKGLDAVIVNPANIIGPYDDYGWARFFYMIDKEKLPGVPPGRASFCGARQVAAAHVAAYEKGRCGNNYLLGGADATFKELVEQIGGLLNRKVPEHATPAVLLKIIGRLSHWISYVTRKEPDLTPEKALLVSSELICSSEKAERELGYEPAPLPFTLKECFDWLMGEGLLIRSHTQ